jgi:hypothetical protein
MNAARSKRGTGDWRFVFGSHNEIIGTVEELRDGRWLASANGQQLGVTNTFQAAVALVREEASR